MSKNRQFPDRQESLSPDMFINRQTILILIVFIIIGFIGCTKPPEKVRKQAAVNVRVQAAETRSLRPFVESIGSLAPRDQVTVSSELDGILDSISVDEGTAVKKGQAIAEIRPTDYRLALEQAAAQLAQSETGLANARQEYERKEALYREELLTKQQFDDIAARVKLAEAEVARAHSGQNLAKERLARTRIFSPLAGTVKEKRATAGDYVRNGSFLASIVRTDLLKLIFSVSEKDVGSLKLGQEVDFITDSFPDQKFRGRLSAILPALDERTRTLQVEALVANADGRLKPGLFARITLYTGPARERVVAPVTSLLYDNSKTKLFVVEGEKAREKNVITGSKYGEYMEIVEGLHDKEVIVTVGQNNLMEGALVHVAR
ncbi:MAG: efflux RND transporter periplasmic adaptor subunit [Syntrophales bacterium]|jgi:membrane fusion protein (multidrug efflux system)|nr:efflux RND transporter periplasmic adaptor subunit [Syntrophales bacterium]